MPNLEQNWVDRAKMFVRKHKIAICVGAGTVIVAVSAYFGYKYLTRGDLETFIEKITDNGVDTTVIGEITSEAPDNIIDFEEIYTQHVRQHIRNLPEGHKASLRQIELAAKYGVELDEGQTFIPSYDYERLCIKSA